MSNRIFSKKMPKEFFTHEHFKARQQSQSDPESWHPVQAICVAVGALSLLALLAVVIIQIAASQATETPSVAFLIRLDQAMYLSAGAFFAAVTVLVAFTRFRQP